MPTWVWIVIGVVLALIVLAALVVFAQKKRAEQNREHAAAIRDNAARWSSKLDQRDADVREVEAEAARARAQADELEAIAEQRRLRTEEDRSKYDDRLREADELDPDVDTRHKKTG